MTADTENPDRRSGLAADFLAVCQERDALREENARLRAALQHYAAEETWDIANYRTTQLPRQYRPYRPGWQVAREVVAG